MRKLFFVVCVFCWALLAQAQQCMTFQDMEKNGLSLAKLDSLYPNALGSGKAEGAFKSQQKFGKQWAQFHEDLMLYLNTNGLKWGKPTNCFNKIYFNADGKIEYWFFNFFKADSIPENIQAKYLELITAFSKIYTFKDKIPSQFTQCATVTFFDIEEKQK